MNSRSMRFVRALALLPLIALAAPACGPVDTSPMCPAGAAPGNACSNVGMGCTTVAGLPGPGDGGAGCVGAPVQMQCQQSAAGARWVQVGGCVVGPLPPPELA